MIMHILKKAAVVGMLAAILGSAGTAWSAPVTVREAVELTFRWVTLPNIKTGTPELIPMWTFSPYGTKTSHMTVKYPYIGIEDPKAPFPGPLLVARQNDMVEYTFKNTCPCEWRRVDHPYSGHTIHLHGLDVNTRNDGVVETSFSILPNQEFTYKMRAPDSGSYVYHCHIHTVLHQNMGMYGGIIIMPEQDADQNKPFVGGPTFNKQYYWLLAEVDRAWHIKASQKQGYGDFGDDMEFSYFTQYNPEHFLLANYEINLATLNTDGSTPGRGVIRTTKTGPITATVGQTLLIRVGNLGYFNNRVTLGGLKFDVVSSDGRPLRDPSGALNPRLAQTTVEVAPGERYDLMVKLPSTGTFTSRVEYLNPHKKVVAGFVTQDIKVQ